MGRRLVIVFLVALAIVPGCNHKVSLTFVNHTPQVRTLRVMSPAGEELVGSFAEDGVLSTTVRIFPDQTPIIVAWDAGSDLFGQFPVHRDGPAYLRIDLHNFGSQGPYPIDGPVRSFRNRFKGR